MRLTEHGKTACEAIGRLQKAIIALKLEVATSGYPKAMNEGDLVVYHDPATTSFLIESGVCRAVDIYQCYNRQILRFAATRDLAVLLGFRDGITLNTRDVEGLIQSGNITQVLLDKISLRDKSVRDHLHKTLGVFEDTPMALLVETRNCIVHGMGKDLDGRVSKCLQTCKSRDIGISVKDGNLHLSEHAAFWACQTVMAQVSIMDQELAHRFSLPTEEIVQASNTQPIARGLPPRRSR